MVDQIDKLLTRILLPIQKRPILDWSLREVEWVLHMMGTKTKFHVLCLQRHCY